MLNKGSTNTLPDCLKNTAVQPGHPSCTDSRMDHTPSQEDQGNKAGTAFLSFSLTSCRCYVGGQSICSVVLVFSVQPLDSGITYPQCISIAVLNFLTQIEGQEESQASGPCELYISDTLFCVHKEGSQEIIFVDYLLEIQISVFRDTDCCLYMEDRKDGRGQSLLIIYYNTDFLCMQARTC